MIHWAVRAILALALGVASSGAGPAAGGRSPEAAAAKGGRARGEVAIVVLAKGTAPEAAARELGVAPVKVYRHVFEGFAAPLPAAAARAAHGSPRVRGIAPDLPMTGAAQTAPTGVTRIGLGGGPSQKAQRPKKPRQNRRAAEQGGGRGQQAEAGQRPAETAAPAAGKDRAESANKKKGKHARKGAKGKSGKQGKTSSRNGRNGVNADVAILDSGVNRLSDLNVVASVACNVDGPACSSAAGNDLNGHGTHVAGIVGARNNGVGVLGVAPGVRIWSVRVLDRANSGWVADAISGLDWVYQHRDRIDVVNMSMGGPGRVGPCGAGNPDGYHLAICRVTAAGVPVVAAAGNQGADVNRVNPNGDAFVPAAYPEVIAVSAMADTDGRPGGHGPVCAGERDDTLARFSNHGPKAEIAAPGVCITSLDRRGGLVSYSGTSMAAPHVAGALARFKASSPGASVEQARAWLRDSASRPQTAGPGFGGDRDGWPEPMLYLGN